MPENFPLYGSLCVCLSTMLLLFSVDWEDDSRLVRHLESCIVMMTAAATTVSTCRIITIALVLTIAIVLKTVENFYVRLDEQWDTKGYYQNLLEVHRHGIITFGWMDETWTIWRWTLLEWPLHSVVPKLSAYLILPHCCTCGLSGPEVLNSCSCAHACDIGNHHVHAVCYA